MKPWVCWISQTVSWLDGVLNQRTVRQRSDYKISAMKRYEPLRFLAGRKCTLALYVNNNSDARRQKLVAVYAFYFYFCYKIVVVHHIFHDAE